MSDSQEPIRSPPNIEDVGDEASRYRIPGAANARTGHHFVAVDPVDAPNQPPSSDAPQEQASARSELRPEEHLPPPTGRDRPPAGLRRSPPAREPSPPVREPSPPTHERSPPGRERPPTGIFIPSTKGGTVYTIPGDAGLSQDQVGLPRLSPPVTDPDPFGAPTTVGDTLTGSTSADLDQPWVIGHPSHGMTSRELRHDMQSHHKRKGGDTTQYGLKGGELDKKKK